MKTLTNYLSIVLIPVLFSCNQDKIDALTQENLKLEEEKNELEKDVNTYLATFNDIETNLAEIKNREEAINLRTTDNVEYQEDAQESIINDIQAINALMLENKQKIEELQNRLGQKDSEFKKVVASLQRRITAKDKEIEEMKTELVQLTDEKELLTQNVSTLKTTLDTLENRALKQQGVIKTQSELLAMKENELNTAYVAIGTYKDLAAENVLIKEGGVLGLGAKETLNEDFNKEAFDKIDITKVTEFAIDKKRAELITNHPSESYELAMNEEEEVGQLKILDPVKFWNSSKYLVVKVN